MSMTISTALDRQDSEQDEAGGAPVHCPHPNECLRLAAQEPRSFGSQCMTRRLLMNRYRRLMAEQCACNRPHFELKT